MSLSGKRPEAHGAGLEMTDDALHGFHLIQRDRGAGRHEFQESPQGMRVSCVIHQLCIFFKTFVGIGADRLLQGNDGLGTVEMVLAATASAKGVETDGVQGRVDAQSQGVKGVVVAEGHTLLDLRNSDSADTADRTGEIFADYILSETDRLENAGGLVGLYGGDPHLGRDLDDTAQQGRVVVLDRCVIILVQDSQIDQLSYALMGQVGTDSPGAEA